MRDTATELSAMVVAYAKQETFEPIKQLGRYVLFGLIGAMFMGIGGFFLALAAVRALQSELSSHLTNDLSWTPYVAGVLVAGLGAALAVSRINKVPNQKERRP
ncbi:MAG: phage holin family protein [Acidimicrobiaceae bacterium]|nr:phage holin family protein [Acidimicrobiaceae bacterium]